MSNNYDKKLLSDLESLGLNEKESLVYIDLLEREKPTGSTKIVLKTGLHRQYVYNALYSLEEKGLIKHSVVNGRKKFEANSPSRLTSLIEEKKKTAKNAVEMLSTFVKKSPGQEFEVFQGEDAYVQRQFNALDQMPSGSEMLVISTVWGDLFTKARPDFFHEYEKKRKEKNISVRFVLSEGLGEKARESKANRYKNDYRLLPDHESYGGICIFNEFVDFYMLGNPIILFSLKNKTIAKGYRNYFEILWKLAKE